MTKTERLVWLIDLWYQENKVLTDKEYYTLASKAEEYIQGEE